MGLLQLKIALAELDMVLPPNEESAVRRLTCHANGSVLFIKKGCSECCKQHISIK
jgi:hypothetical protein